jgi:predicted nucleic acid-binding protein
LIGLARIGRVSVLTSLYGSVVVSDLVLAELHVDSDRPAARALSAALADGAIRQQALPDGSATDLARLCLLLDAGEASAILLAEQTDCRFLLIDERRGRQIARPSEIPVVGLAGVLLAAKRGHSYRKRILAPLFVLVAPRILTDERRRPSCAPRPAARSALTAVKLPASVRLASA